jgi:RNA polymerase sigma factor (sigma-70 family)
VDVLTTTGESDQALVTECLHGDQRAWIRLLNRYQRLIYSVTVRLGFPLEDRHDIFQAVCLETYKSLASLRNASSLRYWILTISVRQCYALIRRRKEERNQEPDEVALTVLDPRADTLDLHLAAERAAMLRESLDELPEPCRSLLELMFFSDEKIPYSELGASFGWSKDTIGSARLRCLERLRRILEDKGF